MAPLHGGTKGLKNHLFLKDISDRILINQYFMDLFPNSKVHHLIREGSDHAPLYLVCSIEHEPIVKSFQIA